MTAVGRLAHWYEVRRDEIFGRRSPSLGLQRRSPVEYAVVALGTPRDVAVAARRVARVGVRWLDYGEIHARLERSQQEGRIPAVPSRVQLFFGGADMVRFLFEPGGRSLNEARGIGRRLYYVLLSLGDPATLLDPGGVTATRDEVVIHLLENFHFSPVYDLQLLETFEGGLAALGDACRAVLDGSHARAAALRARIPESTYFETLARYATLAVAGAGPAAPRFPAGDGEGQRPVGTPEELAALSRAVQAFTELWPFLSYCSALPDDPVQLVQRFFSVHELPTGGTSASPPLRSQTPSRAR
jgi:hypothetical protein